MALRPKPRLRWRLVAMAIGLAATPLLWVGLTSLADGFFTRQLEGRVASGAVELAAGADPATVARKHDVRVRVFGATVEEVASSSIPERALAWTSYVFGYVYTLSDWDHEDPPTEDGCFLALQGALTVCQRTVELPDGRKAVVDAESRRHVRALADDWFAMVQLFVVTAIAGSAWSAWLVRRLVQDVDALVTNTTAIAADPLRAAPAGEPKTEELRRVASAFDHVVGVLRERSRGQVRVAANLAHEVKGAAGTVRVTADLLDAGVDADQARRLGRSLSGVAKRLERDMAALMALARADDGLPEQVRAEIDLLELARGIAADRPSVHVDGVSAPMVVVVDAVEMALRNLIDNAADFAGPTGTVEVSVFANGVAVRDSGPGVPPELADAVFAPWFTTRRATGGHGMGLAVARAIAEAHGGSLRLELPNRFVLTLGAAS